MNSDPVLSDAASQWRDPGAALPAAEGWQELVLWWSCRLSSYGLVNWADDPALLALVFC